MSRFILLAVTSMIASSLLVAAPVPSAPDAKTLVAKLSDPDENVRDEASAALKDRADALPWLRREARSKVPITSARASLLLDPHQKKRQEVVAKAIDSCIREGHIDLLMEWHHYWKPRAEADLWPVGPRAAKAGVDLFAKSCSKQAWAEFEKWLITWPQTVESHFHDGPCAKLENVKGTWSIRTDQLPPTSNYIRFASVSGSARLHSEIGGQFLILGSVRAGRLDTAFVACDGDVWNRVLDRGILTASTKQGVNITRGVVVCRGDFIGASLVTDSVLLVDGDIDLTNGDTIRNSLIRASGEIRLPKDYKPVNCTIEAHAKNATAPYKFFELPDVGLSLADDEEGLVVRDVNADTPFGNCGIAKGDLIRAIDDIPAGHSEEFRKKLRRALVRQGDCLITIVRGDKTLDLPVFFPLPK
jgi:hypothetical protein